MLGLSDRGEVIDLFAYAMAGEIAPALELTAKLHLAGADPAELLIELAEFCHLVTRAQARAERRRRRGDQRERTAARRRDGAKSSRSGR